MTSRLKVTEIADPTNGNTAISIDSNGAVGYAQTERFMQSDGTYIDRPHFEAHSTVSNYNHNFTSYRRLSNKLFWRNSGIKWERFACRFI